MEVQVGEAATAAQPTINAITVQSIAACMSWVPAPVSNDTVTTSGSCSHNSPRSARWRLANASSESSIVGNRRDMSTPIVG